MSEDRTTRRAVIRSAAAPLRRLDGARRPSPSDPSCPWLTIVDIRALREHIAAYMAGWNRNPTPFEWTQGGALT